MGSGDVRKLKKEISTQLWNKVGKSSSTLKRHVYLYSNYCLDNTFTPRLLACCMYTQSQLIEIVIDVG